MRNLQFLGVPSAHTCNYEIPEETKSVLDLAPVSADSSRMHTIGALLEAEANRRELTHEEAADAIGVSQATFSRWVNGDNPPSRNYYQQIATFLKVPRARVAEACDAARHARRRSSVTARLDHLEHQLEEVLRRLERRR